MHRNRSSPQRTKARRKSVSVRETDDYIDESQDNFDRYYEQRERERERERERTRREREESQRERVCVCVCMYIYIYMYIHTYIHTHIYAYTYIYIYIYVYIKEQSIELRRTKVGASKRCAWCHDHLAALRGCRNLCVRASVCVCMCVCVCVCVFVCMRHRKRPLRCQACTCVKFVCVSMQVIDIKQPCFAARSYANCNVVSV